MKSNTIDRAAMQRIGECRHQLTRQQFKTLKGQILAGDSPGALKGLHKIMAAKRKGEADHQTREMDIRPPRNRIPKRRVEMQRVQQREQ